MSVQVSILAHRNKDQDDAAFAKPIPITTNSILGQKLFHESMF